MFLFLKFCPPPLSAKYSWIFLGSCFDFHQIQKCHRTWFCKSEKSEKFNGLSGFLFRMREQVAEPTRPNPSQRSYLWPRFQADDRVGSICMLAFLPAVAAFKWGKNVKALSCRQTSLQWLRRCLWKDVPDSRWILTYCSSLPCSHAGWCGVPVVLRVPASAGADWSKTCCAAAVCLIIPGAATALRAQPGRDGSPAAAGAAEAGAHTGGHVHHWQVRVRVGRRT